MTKQQPPINDSPLSRSGFRIGAQPNQEPIEEDEEQMVPQEAAEEEEPEHSEQKSGRRLKQVPFAIGTSREDKLDELAYQYNRKKRTRIGRNDIARFLFDKVTLDDLLTVDLREYKK